MEISAGGIVFFNNSILLLQKYSGDWVLPKGRVEKGETISQAALREVYEEAGVKAEIKEYLGQISYSYRYISSTQLKNKTVHWFLMTARNMQCKPLKKEGFAKATYVHYKKTGKLLAFETENEMVQRAIKNKREGTQ